MATKAQLQAQIDGLNTQIDGLNNQMNGLKTANVSLAQSRDGYINSAKEWMLGFNRDFDCGDKTIAHLTFHDCWSGSPLNDSQSYVNSRTTVSDSGCRNGNNGDCGCSEQGCRNRIATINSEISTAIQRQTSIDSNNATINGLIGQISTIQGEINGLSQQIQDLPESQAQIQGAVASASANADAEKKKWIIFGIIAIIIVVGGIFIYLTRKA